MECCVKCRLKKFYEKYKDIISDVCFSGFLLINLVAVPVILRKITGVLQGNGGGYINPLSSVWYEQTKEAMIYFEQQNINIITACAIMAAVLYGKYKKLAFLCLIIPLIYVIMQRVV